MVPGQIESCAVLHLKESMGMKKSNSKGMHHLIVLGKTACLIYILWVEENMDFSERNTPMKQDEDFHNECESRST